VTHVITLIGDPNITPLAPAVIDAARSAISAIGGKTGDVGWLSDEKACDLPTEAIDPRDAVPAVQAAMDGLPIDVVGQEIKHRRKKLLVADMDSTIIQQECIDEIADFVGCRAEVSAITERAMKGEMDFPEAVRARAQMFAGLDAEVLERAYRERITLTPGAESLVRVMRKSGAVTALVSGGFTQFTSHVAARTGFNHHHGNELEINAGKLTGKAVEPIKGGESKVQLLKHYCRELGITPAQTLAVGDGANDIPMIKVAGLGVAFHGKPSVTAAAAAQIKFGDLTALLFVQGFCDSEINA